MDLQCNILGNTIVLHKQYMSSRHQYKPFFSFHESPVGPYFPAEILHLLSQQLICCNHIFCPCYGQKNSFSTCDGHQIQDTSRIHLRMCTVCSGHTTGTCRKSSPPSHKPTSKLCLHLNPAALAFKYFKEHLRTKIPMCPGF